MRNVMLLLLLPMLQLHVCFVSLHEKPINEFAYSHHDSYEEMRARTCASMLRCAVIGNTLHICSLYFSTYIHIHTGPTTK